MFEADIYWEGQSGKNYGYWIHRIGTSFNEVAGNYIFSKKTGPNEWAPLAIGHTANLNQSTADPNFQCAKENGATHIHIHTTKFGESVRAAEQQDLIAKWSPPCSAQ